MPLVSVIVPCYNEEGNIEELVARTDTNFREHGIDGEIILVDDASTDGTAAKIREVMRRFPNVVTETHPRNLGIAGGWRTGLRLARGGYVLITDADLQYAPEDNAKLVARALETGADIVQGFRIGHNYSDSLRYSLSLGFCWTLNILFGCRLHDIKSGYIVFRREVFRDVLETRHRYRHFQHFVTISAVSKGYRIVQVPIIFYERHWGSSFITNPFAFSLGSLRDLPKALWEFLVLNRLLRRGRRCAA
ncbi:MAG: glycosyltransferase family 2 protein [bacterium]|nr:glycosyltransferase family 2 protein [bacterium]